MAKTKHRTSPTMLAPIRAARIHFVFVAAYAASIIVHDASNLMTPEAVMQRWKYCLALLVVSTVVWLLARSLRGGAGLIKALLGLLIVADIIIASLLVYAERGMASLSVALYAIPLVTAALTYSRSAILTTASLSTAAYAYAAIKYFVDFFNEGYRVQLYSSIGFYSATFFVLALLLIAVLQEKSSE